ncbi:MAG TPA: HD family hydrolase [Hellea balneolensis]|uniref:HD family hydrolase n=1 Tax=Hellea balneolensis TaxID=287478 RepID=A0A7C3C565_9PROT|nr:HD family hydrolase [Hellea balneolensis]
MLSGRRLDLLDPSPFDIEIEDIAHGLARVARWNGQTSGDHAFSVAEHSVVVEKLFSILNPKASTPDKLAALLHDGAEYVVGDMISPFKTALGLDYKDFEAKIEAAIHVRFGLPPHISASLHKKIKTCDIYCAYFEATQIAGFSISEADKFFTRPPGDIRLKITPLSVVDAQKLFLKRFAQLTLE